MEISSEKLKVGVLAFSSCTNYGGMLQVYAMQEALLSLGHIPEVVDLWPIPNNKYLLGTIHNPYVGIGTRLKGVKSWLFCKAYRLYEQRYAAFREWQKKNFNMTEDHWRNPMEFARNPPKLDLLEVGSDQVFNSDVSKIFLCTDVPLSLPRFSYGASFGNLEKSQEEKERLREGLLKFRNLSVRERSGALLVNELLGKSVSWTVDPVLLPDSMFWKRIAGSVKKVAEDKYVVVYHLGKVSEIKDRVERLHRQTGLPVKMFVGVYEKSMPIRMDGVEILWAADPFDFVGAIANAEYVVSNSFHAMMFSVIFGRKAFFAIAEGGGNRAASVSRFTEIAMEARCGNALHENWPDGDLEFFDMSNCYDALANMIRKSRSLLKEFCVIEQPGDIAL